MKTEKEPSTYAIELAAQIWCQETTKNKVMDTELAMEFARCIDIIRSKPYLGNATTNKLIYELSARCDTGSINQGGNYKTTG